MEEFKKNFILLSKVAKEKKYAQEYLGLLARRGDIGSIRIGKRWYTTWDWFEEFLENSHKKKVENVCEIAKTKTEKIAEKKTVSEPEVEFEHESRNKITANVPVERKIPIFHPPTMTMREIRKIGRSAWQTGDIRVARVDITPKQRKVSIEERNRHVIPYREIKLKKNAGIFSPDFFRKKESSLAFFPRFAYAAAFVLVFLFIGTSLYFLHGVNFFQKGKVAGASDEGDSNLSGIIPASEHYLVSVGDKIKENFSLSRIMMEAAKERAMNSNQ